MSENKQWKKPGSFPVMFVSSCFHANKEHHRRLKSSRIEVRSHHFFQPFLRSELPTLEKIVLSVGSASLKAAIHDHQFNMRKHWNTATDTIAAIIVATNTIEMIEKYWLCTPDHDPTSSQHHPTTFLDQVACLSASSALTVAGSVMTRLAAEPANAGTFSRVQFLPLMA